MKNNLNLKTNILIILMTIFYFFILMTIFLFVLFQVKSSGLIIFFVFYSAVFIIFRYIVLIRKFFSVLKKIIKKIKNLYFMGIYLVY